MVVAVLVARMMEVAVDDVVGVVAMRDSLMLASHTMDVIRRVGSAGVRRRADRGVRLVDFEFVRVDRAARQVVELAPLDVVSVIAVDDCRMAAACTVGVDLALVTLVTAHWHAP